MLNFNYKIYRKLEKQHFVMRVLPWLHQKEINATPAKHLVTTT
jgi:hypothetical protein